MSRYIDRYSKWFRSAAPAIARFRWLIIGAVVILNVVSLIGMRNIEQNNSAKDWLLKDDPLRIARHEFEEMFGNNDIVPILVETDNIWTAEALSKIRALGDELENRVPLVNEVTSITHLEFTRGTPDGIDIDQLVPDPIPTDPAELEEIRCQAFTKEHLVDRLFSKDGASALVVLDLKPYPLTENATNSQGVVEKRALTDSDWHVRIHDAVEAVITSPDYAGLRLTSAGMPCVNALKGRWVAKQSVRLFSMALVIMVLVLGVFFRSLIGVVGPIVTAVSATLCVFGFMGFAGIMMDAWMSIIPALLILVVSIGYSVHVISFFRQAFLATGNRGTAIAHALGHTAWPILFTAITTAAGFLSFLVVPIVPIRWVGATSAALVLTAYPLVIFLTPALLSFGKNRKPNPAYARRGGGRSEAALVRIGDLVGRNGLLIAFAFAVLIIVGAISMTKLEVNTDSLKTMGREVPYVERIFHVAENIGCLYTYNTTIDLGIQGLAKDPEILKKLDLLASEIEGRATAKRTSSITNILKDLNKTMNEDDPAYHRIPDDHELIAQLLLLYEMSGGTHTEDWVDYDYRTLRMMVEIDNYDARKMEEQLIHVEKRIPELFPGSRLGTTGMAVQFARMVNYLTDGQMKSILLALVAICIAMMFVFGSFRLGLIGMIPNIAPVIFATGAMALLDIPLHFMTIMIAPMIIGIAVDDTIHFINHFREEFVRTGSYQKANRETFRSVGKAIFMTSSIIVLGFLAFTTSKANAYQHLGWITIIAVITALAADYFMTPTLIMWIKPWGKERV